MEKGEGWLGPIQSVAELRGYPQEHVGEFFICVTVLVIIQERVQQIESPTAGSHGHGACYRPVSNLENDLCKTPGLQEVFLNSWKLDLYPQSQAVPVSRSFLLVGTQRHWRSRVNESPSSSSTTPQAAQCLFPSLRGSSSTEVTVQLIHLAMCFAFLQNSVTGETCASGAHAHRSSTCGHSSGRPW